MVPDTIQRAMDLRTERGLRLDFYVPGAKEPFTCYPRDQEQREHWLRQSEQAGWKRIEL